MSCAVTLITIEFPSDKYVGFIIIMLALYIIF